MYYSMFLLFTSWITHISNVHPLPFEFALHTMHRLLMESHIEKENSSTRLYCVRVIINRIYIQSRSKGSLKRRFAPSPEKSEQETNTNWMVFFPKIAESRS